MVQFAIRIRWAALERSYWIAAHSGVADGPTIVGTRLFAVTRRQKTPLPGSSSSKVIDM